MPVTIQTTFSYIFSWNKSLILWSNITELCSKLFYYDNKWTRIQSIPCLLPAQCKANVWNNYEHFADDIILRIIYAIEWHNSDVIMSAMASQITGDSIVCSGANQRKHQSSASLAFVRGIHRWPVDSLHKGPVTRIMFSFDEVIMKYGWLDWYHVRCIYFTPASCVRCHMACALIASEAGARGSHSFWRPDTSAWCISKAVLLASSHHMCKSQISNFQNETNVHPRWKYDGYDLIMFCSQNWFLI